MTTVKEFITESYRLISANSPTVPLHGDDFSRGLRTLNRLLNHYASSGLMLTIGRTVTVPIVTGQQTVTVGPATFVPTPNITDGRLANLDNAWLELDGVTYPLIDKSRDQFFSAFKYEPLSSLPRFIIALPETKIVTLRLYPSPSQGYNFNLRGKFQLTNLQPTDTLDVLPDYYERFLSFACARDMAYYKGRADAWTAPLEAIYKESKDDMEAASEVNLSITGDNASMLNGAYRVRAGI